MYNNTPNLVALRHNPKRHKDMAGYDLEIVRQAMRNVVPNILTDPAKLTHLHPSIVEAVKKEYNRLIGAKS